MKLKPNIGHAVSTKRTAPGGQLSQKTQNICIILKQRRPNVLEAGVVV